jgi:hypothetical protein
LTRARRRPRMFRTCSTGAPGSMFLWDAIGSTRGRATSGRCCELI